MLCQQVSCPKCAHRFTVEVKLTTEPTTTGEVIHSCGFVHGDLQPCPTVSRFEEPDRNPIMQADGDPCNVPSFPVGKCKKCGKPVNTNRQMEPGTIYFCSYECYADD